MSFKNYLIFIKLVLFKKMIDNNEISDWITFFYSFCH